MILNGEILVRILGKIPSEISEGIPGLTPGRIFETIFQLFRSGIFGDTTEMISRGIPVENSGRIHVYIS